MDPNATMSELLASYESGNIARQVEFAAYLFAWIMRGGFPPVVANGTNIMIPNGSPQNGAYRIVRDDKGLYFSTTHNGQQTSFRAFA